MGQVVSINYRQAAEWYKKAADQGYEDAIKALKRLEKKKRYNSQRSIRRTQVNMRSEPDINAASIVKLDEGTPVEIIKDEIRNRERIKLQSGRTEWDG